MLHRYICWNIQISIFAANNNFGLWKQSSQKSWTKLLKLFAKSLKKMWMNLRVLFQVSENKITFAIIRMFCMTVFDNAELFHRQDHWLKSFEFPYHVFLYTMIKRKKHFYACKAWVFRFISAEINLSLYC